MADTKLKNLTETTSLNDADILYTVVDPSGTPVDRKITKANLLKDQIPSTYLDTDGTLAANSDTKIASQKATKTYADTKLTNSMSTGKLLGRGTAGTGVVEEITLGTNLSFSGTTLNATGGSGGGDVTGPASAVANNFASFDGTTGKIIKDSGYTNTSFVAANSAITGATKTKVTYDAKGLVTAGADATTADIADSTNKRYVTDANLTVIGNTSGTNTGDETQATIKTKLGAATTSVDGYLTSTDWNTFNGKQAALGFTAENVANKSTSTSLGTSDTLYPTQNAVKVYADSLLGNANALVYKGVLDCSTNPNYPAADAGFMYIASVAGKIGGASGIDVEVGDMIICNTDGTASGNQATVGAYWNVIQKNIVGAVTGPSSSTNNNVAFFDGTTGKVIKDSGLTLSGSNTGDQTITLTGEVTGTGTGSFSTTITSPITNKRITPRVGTTTSSATPTINTDNYDFYHLTAQAVDITSFTTNLSGTPTNAQKLWISVTGTAARAITWGASFEAGAVALPTTTTTTQRLDVGFIWNAVSSKWRCMASGSA